MSIPILAELGQSEAMRPSFFGEKQTQQPAE